MKKVLLLFILAVLAYSCTDKSKQNKIYVTSAMKNVMWKGELAGKIHFDTINKKHLYGLGPLSYLKGEILIDNGEVYISKVTSDSTMTVEKTSNMSAPFFVHGYVEKWAKHKLPPTLKSISDLEQFLNTNLQIDSIPFAFKLKGKIESATIHIQNLPNNSKVSNPKEAHVGQTNYDIYNEDMTIIGFFSNSHKGVFTHHDTNMHLHLITEDKSKMGHLDKVEFKSIDLYLPEYVALNQ